MVTLAQSPRSTTSTLGSASAGPFNVGFRLFDTDELQVYVNDSPRTDWTLSSNFVDGYDDSATITFDSALSAGDVLVIDGFMKADREEDYPNGGPSLVSRMNTELARHAAMLQELQRDIQRTVRILGMEAAAVGLTADAIPKVNAAGDGWEVGPTAADIANAQSYASTASTARDEAVTARDEAEGFANSLDPSTYLQASNNLTDVDDAAAARGNLGLEIGVDVQGYDADTLKADTTANLTAGFTCGVHDYGNTGTGTITVSLTEEPLQTMTVTGDFTLAPPTTGNGVATILVTTDATGGHTLTASGFTKVNGVFNNAANEVHRYTVTKIGSTSILDIDSVS